MKALKIFYLEGCPYCRKAALALKELQAENPAYLHVKIQWIEETSAPALAGNYDYYYVPSIFLGEEKLYECSPGDDSDKIRRQMEKALQAAAEAL